MSELSIVVVNWNTRELVLRCLESAERAIDASPALDAEIWLVDNGSSDGSAAAVAERFPNVRRIELPENRGFAAGSNAALERAGGAFALLLNSDASVTRAALDICLDALRREPDVGAVGPELRHPDGRAQNTIHAFPGFVTELVPRALRETLLPRRFPSKRSVAGAPLDVDALRGAALCVRGAAIEQVGLLDPGYFFFLEETDWCWRLRRAGWRIRLVPGAPVVHELGASSKRLHAAATRIEYHRSLYRFLRRHRGRASLWGVVGLRVAKLAGSVALLALAAAFSARARGRLAERSRVLAWHLRGCPTGPGLAALDAAPRKRNPPPAAGEARA